MKLRKDGCFGFRCLIILDEGICDIVLFFLENEGFNGAKFRELVPNVILINLRVNECTFLLMLEMYTLQFPSCGLSIPAMVRNIQIFN